MKLDLTPMEMDRLNAARGLDLIRDLPNRQNANMDGLRPSVEHYNRAIKAGLYTGRLIIPVGSDNLNEDQES